MVVGWLVLKETERRHGRFDIAGAITSTAGMTGLVLGLVEAGTSGWAAPITIGSLAGGAALLAAFVRIERTAEEPILPLRLLASPTRSAANAARGLGYAGMYGTIFFLTQFLQDVQHHSALITGLGFPARRPRAVFLSSQITSRFLVSGSRRSCSCSPAPCSRPAGCLLLTQVNASTPYPQTAAQPDPYRRRHGLSFVSLTTAALHGVPPADAGAASGLVNVAQQLGAALGLAVLVTVFDGAIKGARTASGLGLAASAVHGIDVAFTAAVAFALAALLIVVFTVRHRHPRPSGLPSTP